jgi:hypothetical protein
MERLENNPEIIDVDEIHEYHTRIAEHYIAGFENDI